VALEFFSIPDTFEIVHTVVRQCGRSTHEGTFATTEVQRDNAFRAIIVSSGLENLFYGVALRVFNLTDHIQHGECRGAGRWLDGAHGCSLKGQRL
jgi:hypothetical protein